MKLSEIATRLAGEIEGVGDPEIEGLAPLDEAGPGSLSFFSNPRYAGQLAETKASAVILGPEVEGPGCPVVRVADAYLGFAQALELFHRPPELGSGVDPAAHVAESAEIGEGAQIAAGVHIGPRVRIGANVRLHPGVVIYEEVRIGDDFTAHANVVIRERVRIGDRVRLAAGAVVGGEGFGYIPLPGGGVWNLRQIGTVEIGDDVEVGANATVDRAAIGVTRIASGAKLDNLVMIAHGCQIGNEALIAAQSGIAGSTRIGARVQMGGQVGVAGHLVVGDDVRLAADSGVSGHLAAGGTYAGYPAFEAPRWRRAMVLLRKLPELFLRVRALETKEKHEG